MELGALDRAVYQAVATTPTTHLDRPLRRLSRAADAGALWLVIAGGVFVSSKRLPLQLHVELRRIGLASELTVVDEPLEGCIRLAAPECVILLTWHAVHS